jgi:hypothetical protein
MHSTLIPYQDTGEQPLYKGDNHVCENSTMPWLKNLTPL